MSKFKVCMLFGGDHTRHPIITRQTATLIPQGYEITVIDSAQGISHLGHKHLSTQNYLPLRLPIRKLNTLLRITVFWVSCSFLAYHENGDIYQAHDLYALLPGVVVAKLRRKPIIYDAHELASEQGSPHSLRNRVLRVLEQLLIPQVDQIITPNYARARIYLDEYNARCQPEVIVNCPPFERYSKTNMIREALQLPDSTRVVLYHGTLMPGRALEELIQACREFREGIVLVIIGEQNDFFHQVLEPLRRSEKLENRVFFLPYIPVEEITQYVAAADLGVVIYKNINRNNYLCAPTKLYEYLMADVPVIACDFPVMRDFLSEYRVGLTFDPDNLSSIAKAVNDFFEHGMGDSDELKNDLERARHRFNWEREGSKFLQTLIDSIR